MKVDFPFLSLNSSILFRTESYIPRIITSYMHTESGTLMLQSISYSRVSTIFRNKWRRFQKHKKLYHQLCPKSFFVVTTTGGRCRFLCVRKIYLLSYSYYVNLHFRIFSSLEKYQKQGNNLFRVWIKTNNYVRNFFVLVLIRTRLLSSFRVFSFNMLWNVQMKNLIVIKFM